MMSVKTNMELEILEQAQTIPNILNEYIDFNTGKINIDLPNDVAKIVLVASGSSYHCARFAADLLEKFTKIESRAIYSSEFLLKNIIPHDKDTLYIFITQSGETSDTLKSVEKVKQAGNFATMCITNVENSTIWNKCTYKVNCLAGIEQGIAATKSFTAQMLVLVLIALKLIDRVNSNDITDEYKKSLCELPRIIEKSFLKRNEILNLASVLANENTLVVVSDGIGYSLAKETALKIKETSYKNINSAILGEFMHGHVAVLNNPATLIYFSIDKISKRSVDNLNNIKRDYNPKFVIIGVPDNELNPDYNIYVKCDNKIQQMFANILISQLLALEIATKLNRNVDNPKGLHKVVVDKNI